MLSIARVRLTRTSGFINDIKEIVGFNGWGAHGRRTRVFLYQPYQPIIDIAMSSFYPVVRGITCKICNGIETAEIIPCEKSKLPVSTVHF